MSASPRLRISIAASLAMGTLLAAGAARCHAQYDNDFDAGFPDIADYRYFEPVDLDLNRQPVQYTTGYFFRYDKLMWAVTGERTTIGDRNTVVLSEEIYRDNINGATAIGDVGRQNDAPEPYTITNDIQNAPPFAEFGLGDRYEFGFTSDDGDGFLIGVIHDMTAESEEVYGFGDQGTGFGSVHVNFIVPNEDFLIGLRDYGTAAEIETDEDDAVESSIENVDGGPGIDAGDGEADNIDGDRVGGVYFLTDITGAVVGFGYDYDDLHRFNIRFENLLVRNRTRTDGVELMRHFWLDNSHFMQKHQNHRLQIGYGVRYMRIKDDFLWGGLIDGDGGWGSTFAETQVDNNLVGPQIRLRWATQKQKLQMSLDGRFMFGYNVQNLDLEGGFGANITTGDLNDPAVAQPHYSTHGRQDENFSPVAELRVELRYLITRSISARVGYTAMFVDNITRGSEAIRYELPTYGLNAGGNQNIFQSGLNFGVEIVH